MSVIKSLLLLEAIDSSREINEGLHTSRKKKFLRTNYNEGLKAENKNPHSVNVTMNVIYYLVSYYLKLAEEGEMMTGR